MTLCFFQTKSKPSGRNSVSQLGSSGSLVNTQEVLSGSRGRKHQRCCHWLQQVVFHIVNKLLTEIARISRILLAFSGVVREPPNSKLNLAGRVLTVGVVLDASVSRIQSAESPLGLLQHHTLRKGMLVDSRVRIGKHNTKDTVCDSGGVCHGVCGGRRWNATFFVHTEAGTDRFSVDGEVERKHVVHSTRCLHV